MTILDGKGDTYTVYHSKRVYDEHIYIMLQVFGTH